MDCIIKAEYTISCIITEVYESSRVPISANWPLKNFLRVLIFANGGLELKNEHQK